MSSDKLDEIFSTLSLCEKNKVRNDLLELIKKEECKTFEDFLIQCSNLSAQSYGKKIEIRIREILGFKEIRFYNKNRRNLKKY